MNGDERRRGPVPQRPGAAPRRPRSAEPTWKPEDSEAIPTTPSAAALGSSHDMSSPPDRGAMPEGGAPVEAGSPLASSGGGGGVRAAGPRGLRPVGLSSREGPRVARPDGARAARPELRRAAVAEGARELMEEPSPWGDVVKQAGRFSEVKHETALFDLSVADRVSRDEPMDPATPAPVLALAWAGPGMGWEEPAGRALPRPAVDRVVRKVEQASVAAAGRGRRVASAGAVARSGGIASAGVLAGGEADEPEAEEAAGGFGGQGDTDPERVSSRRQLALLLAAAAMFLIAVGTIGAALWFAPSDPVVEAPKPPDPREVATAPEAIDPAKAPPPAPTPAELKAPLTNRPAEEKPAKVEKTTPTPQDDVGERLDPPARPAVERPAAERPTATEEPAKPKGPPPSGKLRITFAPGFGGGTMTVECPGRPPQRVALAAPASTATVVEGCSVRLKCDSGAQSVSGKQLIGKSAASCSGCNSDQPLPVCQ